MMIIDPYRFAVAGGPAGDVTIAVQDFATGTSTGSQSFTSSTITGVTPAAALIIGGLDGASADSAETVGATWSFGMVDGTRQFRVRGRSSDGFGVTDTASQELNSAAYGLQNNDGTQIKLATGSTVSGGVSLNFSTNSSPSLNAYFIAFTGADMTARADNLSLGTGTSAIDVTAPGFQPDAVIAITSGHPSNVSQSPFRMSFGIGTNDGTQRCVAWTETSLAADGVPFQQLRNDYIAAMVSNTTGALVYGVTIGTFDANGFSLTPSASASSTQLDYLALNFGGRQFKLVDFTTPTSTGSATITGAGFTPQFALAVLTNLEAVNDAPGSSTDNMGGFALCAIGSDEQWAASWRMDSGATNPDTASQTEALAIIGASATDCDAIRATFTAWTSDGVTVNYTAVQGTGKKGFILFVE